MIICLVSPTFFVNTGKMPFQMQLLSPRVFADIVLLAKTYIVYYYYK